VQASHDVSKANAELVAAQQRIALDTEAQNAAAHRAWLRTTQDARVEQAAHLTEHVQAGYRGYQQAVETSTRSGRDQWNQSRQTCQDALAAAREAYANATREALNVYLSHVKAAWGAADITTADSAMLASLAEASGHAVNAAHALRWSQPSAV
jgi:mitochondrial fission protein ELM1